MDWIYGQIVGFLGNFFALMGNMGVELFELEWVSANRLCRLRRDTQAIGSTSIVSNS